MPVGGRTHRTSNAFRALQLVSSVAETSLAMRADHMDALACGLASPSTAPAQGRRRSAGPARLGLGPLKRLEKASAKQAVA
jgi:hypothetical protein